MNDLLSLINSYRILLGAIALLILTTVVIYKFWNQVSFFWLRIWSAMPVVGKIARASKDCDSFDRQSGWFSSEQYLCNQFNPHLEKLVRGDPDFFIQCKRYLDKVQETGRRHLPFFGWVLIVAMVFVEAMGFSYVLAGWTIPGASEALQQQGAIGIAFLISTLLVYLTHKTGHEIHKNRLIGKAHAWSNNRTEKLIPNNNVNLDDLGPQHNNKIDDDAPNYEQLINRLDTNGKVSKGWGITAVTALFIVAIAIGATYVRGQALDEMLSSQQISSSAGGGDYVDPYSDSALPDELSQIQQDADQTTQQSIVDHQRKGGWGTFIVLACIFVFLQIMGIMLGFFTGFAGKESSRARKNIGNFQNSDEFRAYHERKRNQVIHISQNHLSTLQKKMLNRARRESVDGETVKLLQRAGERTFQTFVNEKEEESLDDHLRGHARQQKIARAHQDEASHAPVGPEAVASEKAAAASDAREHDEHAARQAAIRQKLEAERAEKEASAQASTAQASAGHDDQDARRAAIRKRLEAEKAEKEAAKRKTQDELDAEYEAQLRREMGLDDSRSSS
ncbi:hypothetical protein [Larsenimonas salina]|uniref:hypothetical protein n=1 Tax=Larsenimonas salina TaxID=1295565 RepID=UPI0020742DB4|nr:hypothetical protein [Larsenimonas salina]MCM5704259.1 hypothetical protein [Larsenimonas salina]